MGEGREEGRDGAKEYEEQICPSAVAPYLRAGSV